ncbi:hypothetical protein HRR83_006937 [Exophiala dermatitidis]|uniref:Uncharacterized protein n=1 Tax=Exophiala dermatitidis TaxID=5970 RepID=A0AAN6ITE2_EXODE|nr:hypothetical protein HRR73_005976 [Exophiala dermatitidis]KAJ4512704.1 hypothetical protein HRR74_006402 [Exophiala dermatitidis]KAJ4542508.1 hypothetical protein HRR77_005706 [Exophiala dermatitidis]KAJ4548197.1 hypothetical protein HRR76_000804 [Exophiala dermatitidis]KAJ4579910.1 hypothetical protein HRR81_002073 [Exophiala dermatitidis]
MKLWQKAYSTVRAFPSRSPVTRAGPTLWHASVRLLKTFPLALSQHPANIKQTWHRVTPWSRTGRPPPNARWLNLLALQKGYMSVLLDVHGNDLIVTLGDPKKSTT